MTRKVVRSQCVLTEHSSPVRQTLNSITQNEFLTSEQLNGDYLPFNGAVYVAKLPNREKDTSSSVLSQVELIEVCSLGNDFMSKSVLASANHGGSLPDRTTILQTSLRRQNFQGFPIKMVSQVSFSDYSTG